MKKLCSILLCVVLLCSVLPVGVLSVSAAMSENFYYEVTDGEAIITGVSGTGGTVTIPSTLNGYPVTAIDSMAFEEWTEMTSVTIPNSVTTIGSWAFHGCTGLTSVTIGNGVSSIGASAFSDCTSLTSITIPDSVTTINYGAFSNCTGLMNVTLGNGLVTIGNSAFRGCSGLKSVTIPNGVTTIGDYAFYCCTDLTSVTVPKSVTAIGTSAFDSGCKFICATDSYAYTYAKENQLLVNGLVMGTCGENLTWVYDSSTYTLTISGTGEMEEYGAGSYNGEWVTTAPWRAYYATIKTVVIGDNVTTIGNSAFNGCKGLTSITIPNSVTTIGDGAFCGCTGLTSITIPDSVTSIGGYAFCRCTSLKSVTIPDDVTIIGDEAFCECTGLTEINWNAKAVTKFNFESHVFYNAGTMGDGITVTFGDNVESIPIFAFYGFGDFRSPKIKKVIISDSVTTIGAYAFDRCTELTNITIPASVTSIGGAAFENCPVTIYGEAGSEAERYAAANGHPFVSRPVKMKVFSVPDKVVYNVGEELNVEGLIVAVYLPNKRLEWYYDDFCDISCDDFSTTGIKTVTLTYLGVSTTFTVTVQNGGMAPLPTTTDMVRLMRALLGEEEISASTDYNADGTVDVRDLVRAKKILAE